jgi:hypothetical protein
LKLKFIFNTENDRPRSYQGQREASRLHVINVTGAKHPLNGAQRPVSCAPKRRFAFARRRRLTLHLPIRRLRLIHSTMLRIAIVRSAQALEPVRGAWEHLYRTGDYSIFQSPEWNLLAARAFAGTAEPFVIHAENDCSAAIVPGCITGGRTYFLGDALFDYRDVLAAGDDEVLRRAWQQIVPAQRPLEITAVRGEHSRGRWQQLGFSPAPFCTAPGVCRADISASDFAGQHTRSARLLRRLASAGVEVRVHGGNDSALVRTIYECKGRQGMSGNLFADPVRIEFMVAIGAINAGCEIFTLESATALVAALVTFRDDHVRHFYTVYYDHAWAHSSPGVALVFEVTRRSLEQGLDCDYMTGEQPHKTRFATRLAPLFHVQTDPAELARIAYSAPEIQLAA